jgi:predicted Fe-Mo cluster-binding NifX family protein
MTVAVSADGRDLDARISPHFGRAPFFVLADVDTLVFEVIANPAIDTLRGAGIQAAQAIADHQAEAVLTGVIGPNAFETLQAGGIPVFSVSDATVRSAIQAYRAAHLTPITGPTARPFGGLGARRGRRHRERE